jgi:polar amino acid transport system substrate-binding protein
LLSAEPNLLNRLLQRLNLAAWAIWPRQLGFLLVVLLTAGLIGLLSANAEAARSSVGQIKHRGALIVGVKDNLRPLGFRDEQTPELQGLEIEIARQLAADLLGDPAAVELKPLLNQDRLPALLNGEVDLLVARLSLTEARQRLVEFSRPYYIDGAAFLIQSSSAQASQSQMQLNDLQQQTVAVLNGSDTIATVRSLLPSVRLRGVDSYAEGEKLLASGAVAAFAADAALLTGLAQVDPSYTLLPTLISAEALGVATPKGRQHQELRQQVNQAIERWQTNGWLRQQIAQWGLPAEGFPSFTN